DTSFPLAFFNLRPSLGPCALAERVIHVLGGVHLGQRRFRNTISYSKRIEAKTVRADQPITAVARKTLMHQYRLLASKGDAWLPSMKDVGFRKYSQFEGDGI